MSGGHEMTIFDDIKELVDVPTVARSYGVEVHRGNMALCPFHRERHPSCKLYADPITALAVRLTAMLSSWCRSFSG